jgi:hypothetical protein
MRTSDQMKLPNAERAVIDERKVREYLLSRTHPIGRFKASFFARAGFASADWQHLVLQLRLLATHGQAVLGERTHYGQKYLISGTLTGPGGTTVEVTTVWIVLIGGDAPRLVTVQPR